MKTIEQGEWKVEIYHGEREVAVVDQHVQKYAESFSQSSIYQTKEWSTFMSWLLGKERTYVFCLYKEGNIQLISYAYAYPLFRHLSWLYFSRGPIVQDVASWDVLLKRLYSMLPSAFLKQFVWVRSDPRIEDRERNIVLSESHASFHPKSTLCLDLSLSEDDLLAQMKSKGRYNIRLASKRGVRVERFMIADHVLPSGETPVEEFYRLTVQTTKRDGFSGHSLEYYQQFIKNLSSKAFMILAYYEDAPIAGGIFTLHQGTCTYYYGASSNTHRNLMAPYALQWEAIQYAKQQGAHTYDFLGINTDGKRNTGADLDGVTDFKLKFGGTVYTYVGTYEIIVRPLWYALVRFSKFLRSFQQK